MKISKVLAGAILLTSLIYGVSAKTLEELKSEFASIDLNGFQTSSKIINNTMPLIKKSIEEIKKAETAEDAYSWRSAMKNELFRDIFGISIRNDDAIGLKDAIRLSEIVKIPEAFKESNFHYPTLAFAIENSAVNCIKELKNMGYDFNILQESGNINPLEYTKQQKASKETISYLESLEKR